MCARPSSDALVELRAATLSEPSISVILPNYNHAQYITRAIVALAEQRPPPFEILVIDDASNDNSRKIIEALAGRFPIVSLINNTVNRGVAIRSQQGFEAAQQEYVYFAASDDAVLPGFFRLALDCLKQFPQAGLFCGEAILIDGEFGRVIGKRPVVRPRLRCGYITPERTHGLLARSDNWILTGSAIIRRTALVEAGKFHSQLGSFADGFLTRKIALSHGFCFAPEVVSVWRIFPKGVSRSAALTEEKANRVLTRIPQYIQNDPVFPDWYADKFRDRWRFAAARLALKANPIHRDVLLTIGARRPRDAHLIELIMNLPIPTALKRFCVLCWLAIRFRPTAFGQLAINSFLRAFERRSWTARRLSAYLGDSARETH
jgi:glycosyltransferase involved in cell wall biosynthesis